MTDKDEDKTSRELLLELKRDVELHHGWLIDNRTRLSDEVELAYRNYSVRVRMEDALIMVEKVVMELKNELEELKDEL